MNQQHALYDAIGDFLKFLSILIGLVILGIKFINARVGKEDELKTLKDRVKTLEDKFDETMKYIFNRRK